MAVVTEFAGRAGLSLLCASTDSRRPAPWLLPALAFVMSCGVDSGSTNTDTLPAGTSQETTDAVTTTTTSQGATTEPSTTNMASSDGTTTESDSDTALTDLPAELTVLASGYPRSRPIRLVGDSLVWGSSGVDNDGKGRILRVPAAGGAVETLAAGLGTPNDLTVALPWVFWTDLETGEIGRVGIDGSDATIIAGGYSSVWPIAADATHVYWATSSDPGDILRMPLAGDEVEVLVSGLDRPQSLLLLEDTLVWIESGSTHEVRSMPKSGGDVTGLATTVATGRTLVADEDYIYWVDVGAGVSRVMRGGGVTEVLVAPELLSLFGLAVDSQRLYWTSPADKTLSFTALRGAEPEVWVDGLARPENIALSSSHIFFTDFDAGEVIRIGKP